MTSFNGIMLLMILAVHSQFATLLLQHSTPNTQLTDTRAPVLGPSFRDKQSRQGLGCYLGGRTCLHLMKGRLITDFFQYGSRHALDVMQATNAGRYGFHEVTAIR